MLLLLLLLAAACAADAAVPSLPVGVNYGANADNLPSPAAVASFIATRTTINRVKLFDANPAFISAFANTHVSLPNSALPALADKATGLDATRQWVRSNLSPYVPVGVQEAREFNEGMIRVVSSGKGTPLMPNRKFETYVFSLFDEDLKPGPIAERHFGLFNPDFTPVYDVGLLRQGSVVSSELDEPEVDMLKDIGMEIIERCVGLPLAVKVMGGLLCKRDKQRCDWEKVRNDSI